MQGKGMTLRAARVDAGFTQEAVVEELRNTGCNISKNTLISYEKYRTVPDIRTSEMLARLYNRSLDDIIFYRDIAL